MNDSRKMKCNICGAEVDYITGGCALQFTFCRKHDTTLSNICSVRIAITIC